MFFYIALRPSYSPTGGSTSPSRLLLLLGRSWCSSCWCVPPSQVGGKNLPPLLPLWIRFTSSTESWHFPPAASKRCTAGKQEQDLIWILWLLAVDLLLWWAMWTSAAMCSRWCWHRVCDSRDLAGNSGFGVHLLQNFVTPPTFFLLSTGVSVIRFLRPFGRCLNDVLLLLCNGNLWCAITQMNGFTKQSFCN